MEYREPREIRGSSLFTGTSLILKGKVSAKELSVRNMNRKMKGFVSSYLKVSNPFMIKIFDKKVVVSKFGEKDWHNFDKQLNFVYPDFIRNLKKNVLLCLIMNSGSVVCIY